MACRPCVALEGFKLLTPTPILAFLLLLLLESQGSPSFLQLLLPSPIPGAPLSGMVQPMGLTEYVTSVDPGTLHSVEGICCHTVVKDQTGSIPHVASVCWGPAWCGKSCILGLWGMLGACVLPYLCGLAEGII